MKKGMSRFLRGIPFALRFGERERSQFLIAQGRANVYNY
jgi:hypothetical protein